MIESIQALLILAGGLWLGHFLAGFLRAEALGLALRDWLFRKPAPPEIIIRDDWASYLRGMNHGMDLLREVQKIQQAAAND